MFVWIVTAATTFLANKEVKAAQVVLPYVLPAIPAVVGVAAFIVGYESGNLLARVTLCLSVIGEGIMAFQLAGVFNKLFAKA